MFTNRFLSISTLLILILFIFASCDLDSNADLEIASAVISAEFVEAESGDAVANTEILVSAAFEGSSELIDQGFVTTDEFGEFESQITSEQETVITLLQFTFEYENEIIVVEEEVELELTFEEPLDEADLFFEVSQDQSAAE